MKTWMILLTSAVVLALGALLALRSRLAHATDDVARLERAIGLTDERSLTLVAGVEQAGAERRRLLSDATELTLSRNEQALRLGELSSTIQRLENRVSLLQDKHSDLDARLDRDRAKIDERWELIEERFAAVPDLAAAGDALPRGVLLPWLPRGPVPAGWSLCDGTDGTPDLRGLFLRGAESMAAAGAYGEAARMQPAGLHTHAADPDLSKYSLPGTARRDEGDWRLLFDAGYPAAAERHGAHVHADAHVPAHFTVVYIMKTGR